MSSHVVVVVVVAAVVVAVGERADVCGQDRRTLECVKRGQSRFGMRGQASSRHSLIRHWDDLSLSLCPHKSNIS